VGGWKYEPEVTSTHLCSLHYGWKQRAGGKIPGTSTAKYRRMTFPVGKITHQFPGLGFL